MSKLFQIKEWLTIPEAAKHLSGVFDGEEITEADIYDLALENRLQLSIYFKSCVLAWPCIPMPEKPNEWEVFSKKHPEIYNWFALDVSKSADQIAESLIYDPDIDSEKVRALTKLQKTALAAMQSKHTAHVDDNLVVIMLDEDVFASDVILLNEIADLFMTSDAVLKELKGLFHSAKFGTPNVPSKYFGDGGIFLSSDDGLCVLVEETPLGDLDKPAVRFPNDAVIVVRTAVLREFEKSVNGAPPSTEKPLADNERNNLLKQIGSLSLALAEKSNRYKRGDKPNVSQIADATIETLDALPDVKTGGVGKSSFRESITAGIALLTMP